ncbi:helix-turn-helix domain-containing protein [Streptomyces cyaneofuscatus]
MPHRADRAAGGGAPPAAVGAAGDVPVPPHHARIDVPLHHPHRHDLLRQEWRRQMGHFTHVRDLRLPPTNAGGVYRSRVERRLVGDVAVSDQYSDELAGFSGRRSGGGPDREQVVVHVIGEGALRIGGTAYRADIRPGMLCVRDLRAPWEFAFTEPTVCRALSLPRAAVLEHIREEARTLPPLTVLHRDVPEARLFLAHVDTAWSLAGRLTGAGSYAARDALLMLLGGVIGAGTDSRAVTGTLSADPLLAPPLRAAAMAYADTRLRDRDLSPAVVARALSVSVRTLHRAFAGGEESVMAYVRRRRLEEARADLARSALVSDVAARWHFADTSHFRRAYRGHFGHAPRGG